jgi:ABC-type Zn uptake system ZnuABC Zn-binding protein ZnuA
MIRDTLIELDPGNADTYAANAAAYLEALGDTHARVQTLLDPIPQERRTIVTNHLAFNYFAQRYGLTLVGVVIPGGSTTSEPSVQEVLELVETIQTVGVPAIFTEITVSDNLARQIADEAGADIVPVYTGSLTDGDPAGTYIDYTLTNANRIAEALQSP